MSSNVEKLLGRMVNYEKLATQSLKKKSSKLDGLLNKYSEQHTFNIIQKSNGSLIGKVDGADLEAALPLVERVVTAKWGSGATLANNADGSFYVNVPAKPGGDGVFVPISIVMQPQLAKGSSYSHYDYFINKYSQSNTGWKDRLKNLNPFGKSKPVPQGLVQPPQTLPVPEAEPTFHSAPKEMNAPAEREQEVATPVATKVNPTNWKFDTDVKAAQTALKEQGYVGRDGKPLRDDGLLGPNTQFALNEYRKKHPETATYSDQVLMGVVGRGHTPTPAKSIYDPDSDTATQTWGETPAKKIIDPGY